MKFTVYQDSRIGKRNSNQDRVAYCYSRDALLLVVADGMGGHLHGEVAAEICVQFITQAFQKEARPTLRDPLIFLSQAVSNAHYAILDYAQVKKLSDIPRTTCVACVIQNSQAHWAHAGDSRLYHIRNGQVLHLTKDHSRLQLLIDQGLVRPEELSTHPLRNRIYSCLGGIQQPQIDYSKRIPLRSGDVLALCSDGVWSHLDNMDMVRFLTVPDLGRGAARLMQTAEQAGGKYCDNLSMIGLRWEENYEGESVDSVSTKTMPLNSFSTNFSKFTLGSGNAVQSDLSDDEIEKAIQEINHAIQKFSK